MWSPRFGKALVVTDHAGTRMSERGIDEALLHALIETGELLQPGPGQLFLFRQFPDRRDNLICAAVAITDDQMIVKTVMVNWTLRERT